MMPRFDLVDEGWLPCFMLSDGSREMFGIREVLLRAPEIREIADPSPLVTVSLHRLLLAILHRNLGPEDEGKWRELWESKVWDEKRLVAYFQKWHERFDLFSEHYPFYQAKSLDYKYEVPVSKLIPERAWGNRATLFDHSVDSAPQSLSPAASARYLVAHQAFAIPGLISRTKGGGPSADAAPLVKGAVALVKGQNLFQTLMLNLHRYDPKDAEPFEAEGNDAPAWERHQETQAGDRKPDGYLDLLTWQSRRIRLQPEDGPNGGTMVKKVVIR